MSRIAAPMVGGMISTTVLTLGVIPALYALVKQWQLARAPRNAIAQQAVAAHSPAAAE
jgi:Cu(I)/Ag(I) efflux system membrane protein CusA/SilA